MGFSVLARGKGTVTAQWFRNSTLIAPGSRITVSNILQSTGDTLLTLKFAEIQYQDDATYTATITDACGPVTTAPFTLRAVPNPPWVQVATQGPPSRENASMAYDSDRHVTVLFLGGKQIIPREYRSLGDTWEFKFNRLDPAISRHVARSPGRGTNGV